MSLKIYKSSAGSGKTFTLVKEYLKLCLPNPRRFKYIAALTFTNASAAEMKARILKALEQLADGTDTDMAAILLSEGITPRQLANAPVLLENILYGYSDFNIRTLDSFFQRIVRAFNKELKIPSDFEINIDAEEAMDYAVDRFLHLSDEQPEIHKILISFIREKISNAQSWNIRADFYRIAKEVFKDHSLQLTETDIPAIMDFIGEMKKIMAAFEMKMDGIAVGLLDGIKELGLEIEDFKYGRAGAFSFILKSLKIKKEYEPGSRFLSGLTDDFEWYKKNDPNLRLIEQALNTFLRNGSIELYELYQSGYRDYASAREILKNIYTYSVYAEINKMFDEYRKEKNVVLVSDFTRILSNHIKNEEVSYVYSKIGNRLDHFLIDEFQDTSVLQWASIKPLVENSVSQGNMNLVVGDSKQAIYRWRGGSVELIERQLFEIDFPAFSEKFSLDKNFRSHKTVVDFNNMFFNGIAAHFSGDLLAQIFDNIAQHSREGHVSSGYVEINFIPKPERTRESFLIPAKEKLLDQVKYALKDGFSFKDITILVRDKRDAAETASLLHESNLPFISFDSLQLTHSPTVRLLLSLINMVNDEDDALALAETKSLYGRYFNTEENNGGRISANPARAFPDTFYENTDKLAALPLYELVEELILMFGLNQPDAYLQRFQDAVLEYVIKENGSPTGFLEWWDKESFAVVQPENQDAIQIMTIHKAKGLEFPVVIIPFADWEFNNGKANMIWVNPSKEPFNTFPVLPVNYGSGLKNSIFEEDYYREEALTVIDNLNILYVAFTRAKSRLYINTQSVKKASDDGIKSVPQLMNMVLKPKLNDGEAKVNYGELQPHYHPKEKADRGSEYVILSEYIVNGGI